MVGFSKVPQEGQDTRAPLQMPGSRKATSTEVAPFKGQPPGVVGTKHTGHIVSWLSVPTQGKVILALGSKDTSCCTSRDGEFAGLKF